MVMVARCSFNEPVEHFQGSRFSAAARAQQNHRFTFLYFKGNVVNRLNIIKMLANVVGDDHNLNLRLESSGNQ
jgi:hypothetical protein